MVMVVTLISAFLSYIMHKHEGTYPCVATVDHNCSGDLLLTVVHVYACIFNVPLNQID